MRRVLTAATVACAMLALAACGRDDDERQASEPQVDNNVVAAAPEEPANVVAAKPKPPAEPVVAANATGPTDAQMAEDAAATGMTARSSSTTTTTTTTTTATTQPASAPQ